MSADTPMTEKEMLAHAVSAVQRVDRWGQRGAMQVTTEEITALCLLVVLAGQVPAQVQVAEQAQNIMKGNAA